MRIEIENTINGIHVVVPVPTINDDISDFEILFSIFNGIMYKLNEINAISREPLYPIYLRLQFRKCRFLRQNAVVFFGGMIVYLSRFFNGVIIDHDTMSDKIRTNLHQNGFSEFFGSRVSPWQGNSILFRRDIFYDKASIIDEYLRSGWLAKGWINISPSLGNLIIGNIWEVYANAFEHSETPIGVFSCGQHYPKRKELTLSVVDFGVGIPENARRTIPGITDSIQALQWAFTRGSTSKKELDLGRGLGLSLLEEFIQINRGRMQIFSHDAAIIFTPTKRITRKLGSFFQGTFFNITLKCDERIYVLSEELDDDDVIF